MWVRGYRNSIVHTLEIGVGFRKHPVVKEYFLHGDKYIFSCSLELRTELPSYLNPPYPLPKIPQHHIFIPNSEAVCSGCICGQAKHN